MKKINFKKDVLPHLIAVVVFYLVTIVFFAPAVFDGKSLSQHDIQQAAAGSKEVKDYYEETGEVALWTNSMFSGMPAYLMGTKYTGDLISYAQRVLGLFLPHPVRLLFISFISFYIGLLCFGVRPWLAIAGGLTFGFTGFSIIGMMAGHNAKIAAVSYMPMVLGGVHLAFNRKLLWGFVLTAFAMAMELRSNHLQITYYLLLIVLAYGLHYLIYAIKEKEIQPFVKSVGVLVLAVILSIGCNLGRLWTVMEYGQYSTRGKSELTQDNIKKKSGLDRDYAFQYSNGIFEPIVLFIPNFFGGSSQQNLGKNSNLEKALQRNGLNRQQIKSQVENAPAYWGDQPLTAPYYVGAIAVFLFVLGLLVLDVRTFGWAIGISIVGITMSWGKNFGFNDFLFGYLPGFNKFRSVTFTIIIPALLMSLIGFMGLEKLLKSEDSKALQKKLLMAVGITGGFALLCVLFANVGGYRGAIDERLASYPAWFLEALRADRAALLRGDAIRTLVFVVLFAASIFGTIKKKLSAVPGYALMILLVLIDMFGVSKRFINEDNFVRRKNQDFVETEADKRIKRENGHFRVLNLINPFNDGITSYHHSSIGGYHGAKMGRYQDLISEALTPEHSALIAGLQAGNVDFSTLGTLNMLNAKYFKAGEDDKSVIPNPYANGNAWFVEELKSVNSADEEMGMLKTIDTKKVAVIDQSKFDIKTNSFEGAGSIGLMEYTPNRLVYNSTSDADGLVVFSEIYYPEGWKAYVDGNEESILRVNYVLRALEVPAGEHEIVFEFSSTSYSVGNTIAMISNILLFLLVLGSIGYGVVFQQKETQEEQV